MKTTRNTSKRLLAVALVLLMALGLALPVMASTITIQPNQYTTSGASVGDRFNAYQIFAGNLDNYQTGTDGAENPYDNPNPNWLTNVTWGSGIANGKVASLLLALMNEDTKLADLGVDYETIASEARYNDLYDFNEADATAAAEAAFAEEYPVDDSIGDDKEFADEDAYNAAKEAAVQEAVDAARVEAVKEAAKTKTLGNAFEAALAYAGFDSIAATDADTDLADTASVIAKVLNDLTGRYNNNAALAEAFAKVVAAKNGDAYLYLGTPKAGSTWADDAWKIDIGEDNGYYLIVDTRIETTKDKVNSDYIVGVFGTNTTITVKADGPKGTKELDDEDNENAMENTGSYKQGQTIPFKLTGTVVSNLINYDSYFLAFRDTMDAGLTLLPDSIKVFVGDVEITNLVVNDKAYNGGKDKESLKTANKEAGYLFYNVAEGTLNIVFPDLKQVKLKNVTTSDEETTETSIAISGGETITVTYNAYLNENAVVNVANKNEFHLEFSNNPNNENSFTETPEEIVYIYDFGIDLNKYDASTEDHDKLPGAGFSVKDSATGLYAILNQTGENTYDVAGWISEENLKTIIGTNWSATATGEDLKAVAVEANGLVDDAVYCFAAMTTTTGDLRIEGLAAGKYILSEVIVPTGYDKLANDIEVTFEATYFTDEDAEAEDFPATLAAGMLKTLTVTVKGADGTTTTQSIVTDGVFPKDNAGKPLYDAYVALLDVANMPNGWLPGTGGIGTYVFYITGGLLLAGAALYLVLSAVKKNKVQEQ